MEPSTAIDKAFDVLFHLHAQPGSQGVSEIGRALGLPKSSAHRLLSALRRRALVERDAQGRYRPGAGLLALALGALDREPLVAAARPVLESSAQALGETLFLVAARAGRLLVLDKVEGTGLLRASPRIGSPVPVHASAVGRLYLAHDPVGVELELPLVRYTRHTITSSQRLARAAEAAREQGYAISREEWLLGLTVVAAPVLGGPRMLGAVCAGVPTQHAASGERAIVARVREAAAWIGARVGPGEAPTEELHGGR